MSNFVIIRQCHTFTSLERDYIFFYNSQMFLSKGISFHIDRLKSGVFDGAKVLRF